MSLPDLLAETVGDEDVVAEAPLGGADRLAVTPTRTLVYRGDGLLSDESVDEYSHDVERIAVSTGRRKAKLALGYGLDGDETITVPAKRVDDVLHPILAGVLSATGVTDPGESVIRTFRFSELTLVVTSDRLVKHVGSAVWDAEFEEFHYADLTGLDFEEGTVATAVVLAHDGRSERFKAPNESARAVRETLVDAVCSFHGVDSLEEFRVAVSDDDGGGGSDDADAETSATTDFGEGPDPLSASPVADAEAESNTPDEFGSDSSTATESEAQSDPLSAGVGDPDPVSTGEAAGTEGATTETPSAADSGPSADSGTAASAAVSDSGPIDDAPIDDTAVNDAAIDDAPIDDTAVNDAAVDDASVDDAAVDDASVDGRFEVDLADDAAEARSDPGASTAAPTGPDESPEADAFDDSPFESAGVEGADLATEVAALRRTIEAQSERLDRQSALIEQLIEELRRGR